VSVRYQDADELYDAMMDARAERLAELAEERAAHQAWAEAHDEGLQPDTEEWHDFVSERVEALMEWDRED